jgi:hypothetical protein
MKELYIVIDFTHPTHFLKVFDTRDEFQKYKENIKKSNEVKWKVCECDYSESKFFTI